MAELSVDWEKSAYQFSEIAERVVCLRTAMVLAKEGGSFVPLKKLTDFNLASPVGKGKQWMNWIHIEDLANMYVEAIENSQYNGSYNAVADEMVTNETFMKSMAQKSNKFFLPIPVPAFMMKLIMGEMSSIILEGSRASNEKIKSTGFTFKYPDLNAALDDLINKKNFKSKKRTLSSSLFHLFYRNFSNFSISLAMMALLSFITIGLCKSLG